MEVVGNQRPGIAPHFALVHNLPQVIQKIISILFISKNLPPLYTARDNVMQRSWGIYSRLSWHGDRLTNSTFFVNIKMYRASHTTGIQKLKM